MLQHVAACCCQTYQNRTLTIAMHVCSSQTAPSQSHKCQHVCCSVLQCVAVCSSVLQCVAVTCANSKSQTTLTSASTFTISLLFLHARIFATNSTRLSASSSSIVITRGGIFRAAFSLSCFSLASLWLKNKKMLSKKKIPCCVDEFYVNCILVFLVLFCGLGLGVRHQYVRRKCVHKSVQHKRV